MNKNIELDKNTETVGSDFFDNLWEESWTYIKTVVDVMREPILILDKDLRVKVANESFYATFQVEPRDTEQKIVYELGNGQWNIPALRKLLEEILPENSFFKGFEVTHNFPFIGNKVIMLNARQIHFKENTLSNLDSKKFPPIILLAMEDVTDIMLVAETLAVHNNKFESEFEARIEKLENYTKKMEKEINKIKNKLL